jgi:hypothetical protein
LPNNENAFQTSFQNTDFQVSTKLFSEKVLDKTADHNSTEAAKLPHHAG